MGRHDFAKSNQSSPNLGADAGDRFLEIERNCMTYVRINKSVVGPFENQGDADKLFLMLVRTELDQPVEDDPAVWGSA